MKSEPVNPIPIPLSQRLRYARMRLLPAMVCAVTVAVIAVLWKTHVAAPAFVGQAEAAVAQVSSPKDGVLASLNVTRFQTVKAGESLGQVMIAEPRVLMSNLEVIRNEIEALRSGLAPIVTLQRNAVDYAQARLDWMRQRAVLAGARVNLQLAETEFRRTEELFKEKLVSQSAYDTAKTAQQALQQEVKELAELVTDGEHNFKNLQPDETGDISKISTDPLRTAIAVQESRLRLVEAELGPVTLRAPLDGVVSAIYHRPGETVTTGLPIVAIASPEPVRIVGYLRSPVLAEPRVGTHVEVRTRNARREGGLAQITHVGVQIEAIPLALQTAVKWVGTEMGLAVDISLPPNLHIRPGELVDITLAEKTN
jgi:HlyD family secretion protein